MLMIPRRSQGLTGKVKSSVRQLIEPPLQTFGLPAFVLDLATYFLSGFTPFDIKQRTAI